MNSKLRVIIIEDSEDDTFLILHELKQNGFDLISERVDNAEDLQRALDKGPWDIVISDYQMPGFNGAEALTIINERGLYLPFIILSGKIGEDVAVQMMKAGASDYVIKDNLALLPSVVKRELQEAEIHKEHKRAISKLRESEENYRSIFDAVNDAIFIHDRETGHILDVNTAMTHLFQCTREEARRLSIEGISEGSSPFSQQEAMKKIKSSSKNPQRFEWRCKDCSGRLFWSEVTLKSITIGGKERVLSVIRDISDRKLMEEELRTAAITDDLTGLLNRRGFFSFAEQQLKIANRQNNRLHLVYLDIDDFKKINDNICHKAGDQALVDAANILKSTFRESDIIARIGGDEFVVLLTEPLDADINHLIFNRMEGYLQEYNAKTYLQYTLIFSIGTALYESSCLCTVEDLLYRADQAMYKDKKSRKQKKHLSHVRQKKRVEDHPETT